jgi:hypothetical protein
VMPQQLGPCTEKADCLSGICGVNGTGNCCNSKCVLGGPCGATGCDAITGDCQYPPTSVACGEASCDGGMFQADGCNGFGSCENLILSTCLPFACNPSGCLSTCSSNADCVGGYCDRPSSTCCGLANGAQMDVDGASGDDTQVCCGSEASPCMTLTHAMQLIDEAQAQNVVITATYDGNESGVWDPPAEVYPIVLGWGVELSIYGIAFYDGDSANRALFEVGPVSANDQLGYASIAGGAVGVSSQPPTDKSTILVNPKGTLFLAGTLVYSGLGDQTTAIEVSAGAELVLGQDRSGGQTGTVFIGSNSPVPTIDGYNGIVCDSANGVGCTVMDSPVSGTNSVVIAGQANHDIDAEDFANISLSFAPQIGVRATGAGRANCPSFEDGSASSDGAILIHGKASVTIEDGAVQCVGGTAFALEGSTNGVPTVVIDDVTIEDATVGVHAFAGTATITSSTIEYNTIGVEQDTDGTHIATIDLSWGGGGNVNVVACNISGDGGMIGASVINRTSQVLEAQQVDWDTMAPDVFSCDLNLMNCSCQIPNCTDSPGADGMDAVTESSGSIDTSGNGSAPACAN